MHCSILPLSGNIHLVSDLKGFDEFLDFNYNFWIIFLGLLNSIFEVLYDNDVLSVEAFEKWKNSDDPNENQGKGKLINLLKFNSLTI